MKIAFNPALRSRNGYGMVTFQMKKSEFNGIDKKVVEDTKAPIEKFKTIDNFYNFCSELIEKIKSKDYVGRWSRVSEQRKAMLKEWSDYVLKENDAYTPSIAFMILSSITKDLKPDNDKLPPVLDKGVLAKTVEQIQNEIKTQKKPKTNFEREYESNLKKSITADENENVDKSQNGWITIPSEMQDPEHFEENVKKLKELSHDGWCTKGYNAEPYLRAGEFHIYMEEGNPKLGVRFAGNQILEIQGEKNDSRIPVKYSDVIRSHIQNYSLYENMKHQLKELELRERGIKKFIEKKFPKGVDQYSDQEILEAFGMTSKKDSDGFLTVSHYKPVLEYELDEQNLYYDQAFTINDIGVDEKKLFKKIKSIEGNADFYSSSVTNFENLESIGGQVDFNNSRIKDLGSLKSIGGNVGLFWKITSLGDLQTIGGSVKFGGSSVTSLDNLQSIGGEADFSRSMIKDLGNLKSVGRSAKFGYSDITTIGNLQSIGGEADFTNSKITTLGNLQSVGGIKLGNSQITDLGNLKSIDGNADFENSKITNLGNLQSIVGNADFTNSKIINLGNLQTIEGSAIFNFAEIEDLGNLNSIVGFAIFSKSKIKSLGNLKTIGKGVSFEKSQITTLGNLEAIGGDADFRNSKVIDLGNLKAIGGSVCIENSKLKPSDFDSIEMLGKFMKIVMMNGMQFDFDESVNGWIKIPSKAQDPEHYIENVDKLKNNWNNLGGKMYYTEPELERGEFHIYLENNIPRVGIQFNGDKIEEILDEQNDSKIPARYYDIIKAHIKDYELSSKAEDEITNIEPKAKYVKDFVQKNFPDGIEKYSAQEILGVFGIKSQKDNDGLLTISHYDARHKYDDKKYCTFYDFGIDEEKLFQNIKSIEGDAVFAGSLINRLDNLQSIGGNADFSNSWVSDLGNLRTIGKDAVFYRSRLRDLGDLESIGGNADFQWSNIMNFGKLKTIKGDANFTEFLINDFGNLETIGGSAHIEDSDIKSLGNLQSIGGDAYIIKSNLTSLGNLKSIGGKATIGSGVTDLGKLQTIGEDAELTWAYHLKSLGNLETIGGNLRITRPLADLGNLKSVGGDISGFCGTQIESLGKLETVGGNIDLGSSNVKDLGNLQTVGGEINLSNTQIKELGNLQSVGGIKLCGHSQITNLGNLKSIDGNADFGYLKNINLGNIKTIKGDARFYGAQDIDLGNLQIIDGNADFRLSKNINLRNLKSVGYDVELTDSELKPSDFDSVEVKGRINDISNSNADYIYSKLGCPDYIKALLGQKPEK